MTQHHFNPINYLFRWTEEWYEWDAPAAHKAAVKARDALAKQLKAEGKKFYKGSDPRQLVSVGGIGSGHPHIEQVVTVYTLTEV